MEQKSWTWRKNSSKAKALKALKEEAEKGQELEKSLRYLSEKLTSLLTESDAKDDLLAKQEKVAEEALAGWEKAETTAAALKNELDDALQQTVAAEEKVQALDCSLKECMQQVHIVKEERERIINEITAKMLREEKKSHSLEEKVAEMKKTVAGLVADLDSLNAILENKEKMIENLNSEKVREEENLKKVLAKFESLEKQNASLKYEVYMLGKELQIRNEEKDFNLKSVKAAHKQHLSSVKKITELEEECNKLRVMLRKRLPGPAALAKMKNEVEMLGGNTSETPKKKPTLKKNAVASPGKRDPLADKMRELEEENKILKEELGKKNRDLQSSRLLCAHTTAKLSHAEKQLEGQCWATTVENETSSCDTRALNPENGCHDDVQSSAGSWASALVSELEHFKSGKPVTPSSKTVVSDISLMDDFVQMERLASTTPSMRCEESSKPTQNVPVSTTGLLNSSVSTGETMLKDNLSHWLRDSLSSILRKHCLEKADVDAILEESTISLSDISCLDSRDSPISVNASTEIFTNLHDAHCKPVAQKVQTNLDKAIWELIEVLQDVKERCLVERVDDKAMVESNDGTHSQQQYAICKESVNRVLRCRSSELSKVLECFLQVCNGLLHGSIGFQKFVHETTSALRWSLDHSAPMLEGASFNGNEACERTELCLGMDELYPETELDKLSIAEEVKLTIEVPKSDSETCPEKSTGSDGKNEHSAYTGIADKCFSASQELEKANRRTLSLQMELERLKETKGPGDHHKSKQRLHDGHLNPQTPMSEMDLGGKVVQSFPSLKEALEDRSTFREDLKGMYLDPKAQIGSCPMDDKVDSIADQDPKCLRNSWEISVASEKLAECQETILNIEKQLKALAAAPASTISHHPEDQLSLERNKHPADEKTRSDTQLITRTSSSTDNVGLLYGMKLSTAHTTLNQVITGSSQAMQIKSPLLLNAIIGADRHRTADVGGSLAIVPRKQKPPRVSMWRRLLLRRSKEGGRKMLRV